MAIKPTTERHAVALEVSENAGSIARSLVLDPAERRFQALGSIASAIGLYWADGVCVDEDDLISLGDGLRTSFQYIWTSWIAVECLIVP